MMAQNVGVHVCSGCGAVHYDLGGYWNCPETHRTCSKCPATTIPAWMAGPTCGCDKRSTCETCDKPIWAGDRFCIEHAAAEFDREREARARAQS